MPIIIQSGRFGAAFDPLALTPAVWLDNSVSSSVTTVSGNISQINDLSGNLRHATQGTAGLRMPYSGTQNGLNVAAPSATTQYVEIGSFTLAQPLTVFFTGKCTQTGSTQRNFLGTGGATGPYLYKNNTFWTIYTNSVIASTTADDNAFHTFCATFNGASSTLRMDGAQIASGNVGSTGVSASVLRIGQTSTGFIGTWGEFLICTTPSTTLRDNYETALRTKWGTP